MNLTHLCRKLLDILGEPLADTHIPLLLISNPSVIGHERSQCTPNRPTLTIAGLRLATRSANSALWRVCSSCAFDKRSLRATSTEIEIIFEYSQLLTHLGDLLPIMVIEMKVERVFP